MKNTVVVGLVIIVVAAAAYIVVQQNYAVSLENQAPPRDLSEDRITFTLPDLHGSDRQLSDWNGEARLVNFWATWCAPCRREIPLLKKLQDEKSEKHLQVIGIAIDFMEDVQAYAEEAQFNYPILVGQEDAMAAAEASGVEFIGLPFTLIIARDGSLVNAHVGELMQEHIDRIVAVMRELDHGALDLEGARTTLSTQ